MHAALRLTTRVVAAFRPPIGASRAIVALRWPQFRRYEHSEPDRRERYLQVLLEAGSDLALEALRDMAAPTVADFEQCIRHCVDTRKGHEMKQFLAEARRRFPHGRLPLHIYNMALGLCSTLLWSQDVCNLLQYMHDDSVPPDDVTYSMLMSLCARTRDAAMVQRVLESMEVNQVAVRPTIVTSMIKVGHGASRARERLTGCPPPAAVHQRA